MQLLVRLKRKKCPLRLLVEVCSYVFDSTREVSGGRRRPPGSPALAFKGGVKGLGIMVSVLILFLLTLRSSKVFMRFGGS